ncbi:MAG: serine/threonine-protein kinase [Gemmatimonadaceae bacterium]
MAPEKVCPQCGGTFGPDERFCPKDGTSLRPKGTSDSLIGQLIADRYQILSMLGEGGMGRVYLAEHVRMGRKSAVKVLSPNLALAPDAISRFNREAANASRINHPNVAGIYDFGETDDGLLYLAMEFVEGETLAAIIKREGALAPRRAAGLVKQTADALAAAHHMGIVHRDLKPDNIMVARHHDGTDWVKVVDFGIAKTVQGSGGEGGSQTVTTAGVSIGTPEYMSPEQLAGDRLDQRTDLYSLGLVLFNMLTGDLPYPRVTSRDTLVRRLTTKPMTLREVAPSRSWPPALQLALDRALAPDAKDRYESVAEFGRDVLAATDDTGVERTIPVEILTRPRESVQPPIGVTTKVPSESGVPTKPKRGVLLAAGALLIVGATASAAYVIARGRASAPPAPENPPAVSVDSAKPTAIASKNTNKKPDTDARAPAKPVAGTTDEDRIRVIAGDVQGHFLRANDFVKAGEVPKARAEYRETVPVVALLRQLYSGSAGEVRVEQMLRQEFIQTMATCRSAVADPAVSPKLPAGFRCEALIPPGVRARGRARAGGGTIRER